VSWASSSIFCLLPCLLLATLVAILRLFALRRRANVIVEQSWLTALAHAQRRMGIKSGTALLVSTELSSPVSWGVLRPIILLSEDALDKPVDAEAIIAHELAHVARFDWVNLLVARVATAMFWFNPLVWLLARQGTSCARKRPTTRCCAPTSPTPNMPPCWSVPPAMKASR
jgi:beta-lactamase regulating signal transducer with metallopeptidase domain